jgi:hypothetical protein
VTDILAKLVSTRLQIDGTLRISRAYCISAYIYDGLALERVLQSHRGYSHPNRAAKMNTLHPASLVESSRHSKATLELLELVIDRDFIGMSSSILQLGIRKLTSYPRLYCPSDGRRCCTCMQRPLHFTFKGARFAHEARVECSHQIRSHRRCALGSTRLH